MIPITTPKNLGEVLRKIRKEHGLTQHEAGKRFNLPQKTISRIESGIETIQSDSIFRYLAALNLEILLQPRQKIEFDESMWE